jgi:hypothetical protein
VFLDISEEPADFIFKWSSKLSMVGSGSSRGILKGPDNRVTHWT